MNYKSIAATVGVLFVSACATTMGNAPARVEGGALVNTAGMTLYTFDKDAANSGKSVCNGPCAHNWPPLMASASDAGQGSWSVIMRNDGSRQWAYEGKPLYAWIKDQKPGDRTGDGVLHVWHVAMP